MPHICCKNLQECRIARENKRQATHPSNGNVNETGDEDGRPDNEMNVDRRLGVIHPCRNGRNLPR